MAAIILTPGARHDLRAINAYIGERGGRSVAKKFVDRIEASIQQLSVIPLARTAQPQFGPDIRRAIVKRYLIFYRVKDETVYVLRVLHSARNITRTMIK